MHRLDRAILEEYLRDDPVTAWLDAEHADILEPLTSQRWLRDSAPKRLCFWLLYGDLLSEHRMRVADIGGGLTALTRVLSNPHEFHVVDPIVHDSDALVSLFCASSPRTILHRTDWAVWQWNGQFNLVVANDLFPNVDQRLPAFLSAAVANAKRVRLSLTFYDNARAYQVRRVDADEVMWMLAWDGVRTCDALKPFASRIENCRLDSFSDVRPSVFPNGRQVVTIELRGDIDA